MRKLEHSFNLHILHIILNEKIGQVWQDFSDEERRRKLRKNLLHFQSLPIEDFGMKNNTFIFFTQLLSKPGGRHTCQQEFKERATFGARHIRCTHE